MKHLNRLAAALVLLTAPAAADNFTVEPSQSVAEIQAVLDGATDGDTVRFNKGTYVLDQTLFASNAGVTLKASKAVLDARHQTTAITVLADGVTVQDFRIVNGNPYGIFVASFVEPDGGTIPDGVTVTKNRVDGCDSDGIHVQATNATITSNRTGGNLGNGIAFIDLLFKDGGKGPESTVTISKNQAVMNSDHGIEIDVGSTTALVIEKNLCLTNDGAGLSIERKPAFPPDGEGEIGPLSVVAKNTCHGNADDGIRAEAVTPLNWNLRVEKNQTHGNLEDGVDVNGSGVTVTGNKADRNQDEGADLDVINSLISKNRFQFNGRDGLEVNPFDPDDGDGGGSVAGDNDIESNTCKGNAREGIEITSEDNALVGNRCLQNLGDGIDLEPEGITDNRLEGNICTANNHEGIDNGGGATDIVGNKCKGNAHGAGPDLAGTGDGGVGSTDEFEGNSFATGGEDTQARLDFPD